MVTGVQGLSWVLCPQLRALQSQADVTLGLGFLPNRNDDLLAICAYLPRQNSELSALRTVAQWRPPSLPLAEQQAALIGLPHTTKLAAPTHAMERGLVRALRFYNRLQVTRCSGKP